MKDTTHSHGNTHPWFVSVIDTGLLVPFLKDISDS